MDPTWGTVAGLPTPASKSAPTRVGSAGAEHPARPFWTPMPVVTLGWPVLCTRRPNKSPVMLVMNSLVNVGFTPLAHETGRVPGDSTGQRRPCQGEGG